LRSRDAMPVLVSACLRGLNSLLLGHALVDQAVPDGLEDLPVLRCGGLVLRRLLPFRRCALLGHETEKLFLGLFPSLALCLDFCPADVIVDAPPDARVDLFGDGDVLTAPGDAADVAFR